MVATLRTLEKQIFPNGAEVEIRDVDYNLLSFEDQIKNDLETDVMVSLNLHHHHEQRSSGYVRRV